MQPRLTTDWVTEALQMVFRCRFPSAGLIFPSDRGTQYTSNLFQKLLKSCRIGPSLGRIGLCFDNAAMESFLGMIKTEWVHHQRFAIRQEAR